MRSTLPDECAEFRFLGTRPVAEPREGQQRQFEWAQRAIQSDKRTTSDQEGAEEILERTGMALFRRDWLFQHYPADNETLAVVWQHGQNRDWSDRRRNGLDAGKNRRS
jgi:hypothetical protein